MRDLKLFGKCALTGILFWAILDMAACIETGAFPVALNWWRNLLSMPFYVMAAFMGVKSLKYLDKLTSKSVTEKGGER